MPRTISQFFPLSLSLMSILFGFSANANAQAYSVVDLKTIAPYWWTTPLGLNQSGMVVGYSIKIPNPDGPFLAWQWTLATGIQSLGFGKATAINNAGDVAGWWSATDHAFLWKHDGTTLDLGSLNGAAGFSTAAAINSDDWIVGSSSWTLTYAQPAFLWTPGAGMQSLGTLGDADTSSSGNAVSDSGEIAGVSFTPQGTTDVFSWTHGANMQNLGHGEALGINVASEIVGYVPAPPYYLHAALWRRATVQDLGTLDGNSSTAYAVNDFGTVVGTSDTTTLPNQPPHAFVWTAEQGMQDLNLMIPASVQKQWRLTAGNAINNAGQIAVLAIPEFGVVSRALLLSPQMYVTLTSSPNPSTVGEVVTMTATITSIVGAPPDGEDVTFKSGSTVLGTSPLSGGVATLQTSSLTQGTHNLTATYAGDVNYASAKSPAVSQVVNK